MRMLPVILLLYATELLCVARSGAAQALPFSDEPYVVTKALTNVAMNADATGIRMLTFGVRVQSQAALQQFSVASVNFASRSEKAEFVYVRVIHPDGTTQETDVAQTIEMAAPVTQQAPFYSDLQIKQLPVKSLRVGDTLEWQARFTVEHPIAPGQIWGQDTFINDVVCLDESYELRLPTTLHLKVWTNPRLQDAFSESNEAGTHIYRWHHVQLKPTVGAAADAFRKAEETRWRTTDEELDLTEGMLPSLAWSSFEDWAGVGNWYRTLTADRTAPDGAIRAKVAELIAGKSTDLEKAQALYDYVSAHIRYIGVAFGIGRYQPHTAAEILANQYGDCKDKEILLASMLSVLNLHADPVLIGAGVRFNAALPSPEAFNHLIMRVTVDGSDVWLDSTAEVGPWGALLSTLRDREALVIPANSPAVIVRTPVDLPFKSFSTAKVVGSLDTNLTSDSTMVLTYRSDDEFALRAVLRSVAPSNYGALVQQLMANMGFGGTTSAPAFEHVDDTSQPIQLSFHYHRLKEKDWGDNRITANFQPISLPSFAADRPPVIAIRLGAVRTETSTFEMKLPNGWSAELPEPVHAHASFATCDVTYRIEHGTLFAERRLAVLQSKVGVQDYKKYQAWYDDAGASGYPYIQLRPAVKAVSEATIASPSLAGLPTGHSAGISASRPEAHVFITKAEQSLRDMDLDSARKALDQAAAVNPTEAGLWAGYANLAFLLAKRNESFEDIQRELSYHPDEVQYYPAIARYQLQMKDPNGALATYRAWVRLAPDAGEAALGLVDCLLLLKQPAEALDQAHAAIMRLSPDSSQIVGLHIMAGNAQFKLGHPAEAAAEVEPLLRTTLTPSQTNDIAYLLAQLNLDLEEARAAMSLSLAAAEHETIDWTLADSTGPIYAKQMSLSAAWDTMAWILYRQEKYSEAFAYEDAARRTADGSELRDHMKAIVSALHVVKRSASAQGSVTDDRTFPLGPANGRKGVASFKLLLAGGKVISANPTRETSSDTPALLHPEKLLQSADLHALFPPASPVHLVREGFVNCHSDVCELVLTPLQP